MTKTETIPHGNLQQTRVLVVLMALISLLVFSLTSYLSYRTSLDVERETLRVMAERWSHTLAAVLRFDQRESSNYPGGSLVATLSQIREAHREFPSFRETGEFLLARAKDGEIEFLVPRRFAITDRSIKLAATSNLAEPMRRGLAGEYGSIIALDYRKVMVLAGYAPVENSDLAVVMKVDLSEVRSPFIDRAIYVALLTVILIGIGAWAFSKITNPIVASLVANERRLSEAQRIAKMGNWEWDIRSGELFWSREIYRIFGFSPAETNPTYALFIESVYPEDRTLVSEAVDAAVRHPERNYAIDHRVLRLDGSIRFVQELGEVEWDANGEAVRMVGTVLDITERKKNEQSLLLLKQAAESINDAVFIVDVKGRVVDCNPAFELSTGYADEEVVGKRVRFGRCPLNTANLRHEIFSSLRRDGQWHGHIWDARKQGGYYPAELSITTIHDEHGRTTHAVAVFRDVTEQRRRRNDLEQLAYFDSLTGLPNRWKIESLLQERITSEGSGCRSIWICLLDIDHFKLLNTTFGRDIGDQVIQGIAQRLSRWMRPTDVSSRYGGDEFALLLDGGQDNSDIENLLESLFSEMKEPLYVEGEQLFVGISAGLARYPTDGTEAAALFSNAELALDEVRSTERRGARFYSGSMKIGAERRQEIETLINKGLHGNDFTVYYQPKLDLRSGRVVGAEALLRWFGTDGRLLEPSEFIPVAESSGLIVELGDRVIDHAMSIALKTMSVMDNPPQIAINLSARQFLQKDLVERIEQKVRHLGLPPSNIEFEVTETAAFNRLDQVSQVLKRFRDLGFSIAIDDFGTGYSSLSYLKHLPVDTLKVDRSFVSGAAVNPEDAAMASAILAMGRGLHLTVVAEGVETREQLDFFRSLGCDIIQGYYFSKPLAESEFLTFLANHDEQAFMPA